MRAILGFFTGYDTLIALGLVAIAVVVFVASRVGVLPRKSVPVAVGALLGLLGLSVWQSSRRKALQQEAKQIKDRIAKRDETIARLEGKYREDRTALDRAGAALDQQLAAHERELERLEARNREERAAIERLAAQLGLSRLAPAEAVRRVRAHFLAYSYSTFREAAPPRGATALSDFLERSKSGHCEYFATATTLLLRAAGVPTRYATGFAMLEYSDLEEAYVVRARHAHSWTRAWVDGQWIEIDTTPPDWFGVEERQAPLWQGLSDLLRWAGFRWSQRAPFEAGPSAYALLALLVAILVWRLLRGRRTARDATGAAAPRTWPGTDSAFYAIEERLAERYGARAPGEALGPWIARIGVVLDASARAELLEALELHQRSRFDPAGVDAEGRRRLVALAAGLERGLRRG